MQNKMETTISGSIGICTTLPKVQAAMGPNNYLTGGHDMSNVEISCMFF